MHISLNFASAARHAAGYAAWLGSSIAHGCSASTIAMWAGHGTTAVVYAWRAHEFGTGAMVVELAEESRRLHLSQPVHALRMAPHEQCRAVRQAALDDQRLTHGWEVHPAVGRLESSDSSPH